MKIIHGIYNYLLGYCSYRNSKKNFLIPHEFMKLLDNRMLKFKKINKFLLEIEFTIGFHETDDYKIWAIAICHPNDNFCRKVGYNIVKTRINSWMKKKYQRNFLIVEKKCEKNTD